MFPPSLPSFLPPSLFPSTNTCAPQISVRRLHEFPMKHGVTCVCVSVAAPVQGRGAGGGGVCGGRLLVAGSVQNHVTIYRLDDLAQSGPPLKMLKRSTNLKQDLQLYMHTLGNTLLDGTLLEWLIVNSKELELAQLLQIRPGVCLLPLACGKSALELATLMRSAKTLEHLLEAAVSFALNGEPSFTLVGPNGPRGEHPSHANIRLLPPAMRRVTDAIRVALHSEDMSQVIARFLRQLPTLQLQIPPKLLPRTITPHFMGSPSPSGCSPHDLFSPIWSHPRTAPESREGGFSSSAEVIMLPGLANSTILQLLADQTPDLLYTEPIRCLIDAMRQNGIERIFYIQCLVFWGLICCYTLFVFAAVSLPAHTSETVNKNMFVLTLSHAEEYPWLWAGAVSGAASVLMSIYFLLREAHELFGDSAYDEEALEAEQSALLSKLGVSAAVPNASKNGDGVKPNEAGTWAYSGTRASPFGRLDPHKRASVWSAVTRLSDSRSNDRRSIAAFSRASTRSLLRGWSTSEGATNMCDGSLSLWKTVKTAVNVFSWKDRLLVNASRAATDARTADEPSSSGGRSWPVSGARTTEPQRSKGRAAGDARSPATNPRIWAYSSKGVWKRLRAAMSRWLCMDASYFLHLWNILGLLSYALVISSFVRFVLAWAHCADVLAGGHEEDALLGAGAAQGGEGGGGIRREGASARAGVESCREELVQLRVLTALAIPVLYLYSLYYLRSVDTFAFYVRMLKEIIKDFVPFLVIFIWFVLSVTAAFWSLACAQTEEDDDAWRGFAALLHAVAQIPFETQSPSELEACFVRESPFSATAHVLFWYLVFMLSLLSLNALIAIMGSTYNTVSKRHKQQQYKEWAQIIGDVVRQWPDWKRAQWEKQFYWIHALRPRKGTDAMPSPHATLCYQLNHELGPEPAPRSTGGPRAGCRCISNGACVGRNPEYQTPEGYISVGAGESTAVVPGALVSSSSEDFVQNGHKVVLDRLGQLDASMSGVVQMMADFTGALEKRMVEIK